ncbi:Peptidase inhibitor I9 [Streptomyces sp. TLI_053]|uniref:S8 family peptidase n=1 Tax=Streptomyces sp. TLI_053 TaxID=1855352 RepID=UPI00087D4052|nr:S8 family peptidase [Streptomyces sp. TLI_053]SDT83204.1 Peptidase inhibitor I9 [Streptomyces sp. TLI_053]
MHSSLRRFWIALLLFATLLGVPADAGAVVARPGTSGRSAPAPLHTVSAAVPGRYIVTLQENIDPASVLRAVPGISAGRTFTTALNGFSAELNPLQLRSVRALPGVEAVEQDAVIRVGGSTFASASASASASGSVSAPGSARRDFPGYPARTWGQDRIDQRRLPLDGYFKVYGSGAYVNVYVADTGIDLNHREFFPGRAVPGFDAIGDGQGGQDCNGHGTHVAGTVAGQTYGIARLATVVSVRVLDCGGDGTTSQGLAGLDWVAREAKQPAVLNLSFGEDASPALNRAVDRIAQLGTLPVVAAGNDARDACGISPASAARAVTVGATDASDHQADTSNTGPCLTLQAPGVDIRSAGLGGGSVSMSGTSMASPHVAAVAALYKEAHPGANADEVKRWLIEQSTKNVLTVSSGSPDRLLNLGGL